MQLLPLLEGHQCVKSIYYYALTLQHRVYCTSPPPVAEMFTVIMELQRLTIF